MKKIFFVVGCLCMTVMVWAQKPGQVIDEVIAVVGNNIIMQSEVEMDFIQIQRELGPLPDSAKCNIMRQKIIDNIMLAKAQQDSVVIGEDRVDAELEKRIHYYARQFGGEKNMEEFYGKSVTQIKADNRDKIKNGLYVQEMQQKALKDVKVAPTDIKKLFSEMQDSLPYYSAEVEVAQLVLEPQVSKEAKEIAYQKILDLRMRVVAGESFNTLALIYSDDKGSATNGGELGFFTRGDMVPEFEAAAFRLKPDSISRIIETKYGYHILKLINRKGENINVRHILIRPQIFRSDIQKSKDRLDSILWQIKIDSLTFENAAKKFSADEATKNNGGFITEGQTGTTKIPVDELEKEIYFKIQKLKPGEITEPEQMTLPGPDQQKVWRVFYLKSEAPPHRANLRDDYQKFQSMALQKKQAAALNEYITKARKDIYIKVNAPFDTCKPVQDLIKLKKI